jgi:Mlc titration factor MtfA (ptsG expression regulator)
VWSLKKWRRKRILRRTRITPTLLETAYAGLPVLHGLDPAEQSRLTDLAVLFLHEKSV